MASNNDHQAAFRARRKNAGHRKLSFYLEPEDAALLDRLKAQHGTDRAPVIAALRTMVGA